VVDMGGRLESRGLWTHSYDNANAIIFVIDSSDEDRFDECGEEINKMSNDDKLENACFLFLANKQDLQGATPAQILVDRIGLNNIKQSWTIVGTSVLDATGLEEALDWMIDTLKSMKKRLMLLSIKLLKK